MKTNKTNIILITMDEVRPDRLSCYGQKEIETSHIDRLANDGALFEECISTSCFTPVSHASILTGLNPPSHEFRDPFVMLKATTITDILKENGYICAGFVGVNLIGSMTGFNRGFAPFDEPKEGWRRTQFKDEERERWNIWGNFWTDNMLQWLKDNHTKRFFIWGHYFDCHQGAELPLIQTGRIKEGELSNLCYYNAKVKYMDDVLFGRLIDLLNKLNIYDETIIIATSDHGTNIGEHPVPKYPNLDMIYPQHTTLYDCDLRVPLIIKGGTFPRGKRIKGMVRSIDIVPTLLDITGISTGDKFDGKSLASFVAEGKAEGLIAYAEELYEKRGHGDFQAMRSDAYKYIVNRRNNNREFYNVLFDPMEQKNIIENVNKKESSVLEAFETECDALLSTRAKDVTLGEERRKRLEERMRLLGYIK